MPLITDQQTLDDLSIFAKRADKSVYGIFNHTVTRGGAELLKEMFQYPLSDTIAINRRVNIIRYFNENNVSFTFDAELFDIAEQYLDNTDKRSQLQPERNSVVDKLNSAITGDTLYKFVYSGVTSIINIVNSLYALIQELATLSSPYQLEIQKINEILVTEPVFASLPKTAAKGKLSYEELASLDSMLRFKHKAILKTLFVHLYHLDVYISVANVAKARGFKFPTAVQAEKTCLFLEAVYNPLLTSAVPNNFEVAQCNVTFLTGANMAGKSTFMKSIGTALYLAHMGFPVAARRMEFSVMDGMYTTINLPDNLSMGISHFYAEVLRIKKIAKELARKRKLFVIIDELFRGTNVKDACEATVAITKGFANKRESLFVISTHIIEAGEVLKQERDNIAYKYLPTRMNGNNPIYTYTLEDGITADRHGMLIINNEGIIDMLKKGRCETT